MVLGCAVRSTCLMFSLLMGFPCHVGLSKLGVGRESFIQMFRYAQSCFPSSLSTSPLASVTTPSTSSRTITPSGSSLDKSFTFLHSYNPDPTSSRPGTVHSTPSKGDRHLSSSALSSSGLLDPFGDVTGPLFMPPRLLTRLVAAYEENVPRFVNLS